MQLFRFMIVVICLHPIFICTREATVCGNWNQGNSEDQEDDLNEERQSVT